MHKYPIPCTLPGWLKGEGGKKPTSLLILSHVCRVPACEGLAFRLPPNLHKHYAEKHSTMDFWNMWKRFAKMEARKKAVVGEKHSQRVKSFRSIEPVPKKKRKVVTERLVKVQVARRKVNMVKGKMKQVGRKVGRLLGRHKG